MEGRPGWIDWCLKVLADDKNDSPEGWNGNARSSTRLCSSSALRAYSADGDVALELLEASKFSKGSPDPPLLEGELKKFAIRFFLVIESPLVAGIIRQLDPIWIDCSATSTKASKFL